MMLNYLKNFHADRKITMPYGCYCPLCSLKNLIGEMVEKMKLAVDKLVYSYDKGFRLSKPNLTKVHADPDLADAFCALFNPIIMFAAVVIIAENIPDLEALNSNDNKLHGLEHMMILTTKFMNLKKNFI